MKNSQVFLIAGGLLAGVIVLTGLMAAEPGGAPSAPKPTLGSQFDVRVERVGLNAVYLPDALVTITNNAGENFGTVTVECRFLDRAGALIDVGEGWFHDVGAGATVSDHAQSTAQYQRPKSAECRVSSAY